MAFADDLVLIASSTEGLREQVRKLNEALHLRGLSLNPAKCVTLRIDIDGSHWEGQALGGESFAVVDRRRQGGKVRRCSADLQVPGTAGRTIWNEEGPCGLPPSGTGSVNACSSEALAAYVPIALPYVAKNVAWTCPRGDDGEVSGSVG